MPMESRAIVRRLYEEVWNKRKLEVLERVVVNPKLEDSLFAKPKIK